MTDTPSFTAFAGHQQIAQGDPLDVALAVKAWEADGTGPATLTFDDASGAVIDFDLRGTADEIAQRLATRFPRPVPDTGTNDAAAPTSRRRGRPKLGVVAREVTLLPRHWDWLARQPGGASQALRRLVDQARRADAGATDTKAAREACYRFMSALTGDLPGFEEATRALFAADAAAFERAIEPWPLDLRAYALKLAQL